MFERFSTQARRIVVLAQEEARLLDHSYIGTEHILLGLIAEGRGPAAQVLSEFDVTLDSARGAVEAKIGRGKNAPSGFIPFTPRAKKVLELSLREALELRQNFVGSGHILLAIFTEGDGVAAKILAEQGVDAGQIRDRIEQEFADDPGLDPGAMAGQARAAAGEAGSPGEETEPGPPTFVRWPQVISLIDAIEGRLTAIEGQLGITIEPPEDAGEPAEDTGEPPPQDSANSN
jgi:ATP-dependent Clp protease ATP-binding subunit ClpC